MTGRTTPAAPASSYRERTPVQTWKQAAPLMSGLGITRLTDITRIDRLGLPVWASVRPRGRVMHVHAGKALRSDDARIGALMEAVEYAAAEPSGSPWKRRSMTLGRLARQFDGRFGLPDLAPRVGLDAQPDDKVATVDCELLNEASTMRLPATLVFAPFEGDVAAALYGSPMAGLASGNSVAEASLHGLLEILERDAVSMNKARDASSWVDTDSLPETFANLARRWSTLGVELAVRHVPSPVGLPCFEAFLHEAQTAGVRLAAGAGLHVDREIALARAVCEAAQSRLSLIHGARDDIGLYFSKTAQVDEAQRQQAEGVLTARIFSRDRTVSLAAVPHCPRHRESLQDVLDRVLVRVRQAGFAAVLRHCFELNLNGLHVVKLVVPGCEDIELDRRRVGPRLMARVLGHG